MQQRNGLKHRTLTHIGFKSQILFMGLFFLLSFSPTKVSADAFNEYQVKAVFLYNLTNFVTWPQDAFQSKESPFIIGILGENPFGEILQKILGKEKVDGRPIAMLFYADWEQLQKQPCHMLYVSSPPDLLRPRLWDMARAYHMLTISDMPGFVQKGGVINLVTRNRRIEIEINHNEAKRTGLEICAQLLNLAKIY